MDFRRKLGRTAWLLLAGLTLVVGFGGGPALGEPAEPPTGLGEVKPAAPMPTFNLPGVNGHAFDSSTLQGKVVVVRFWATW